MKDYLKRWYKDRPQFLLTRVQQLLIDEVQTRDFVARTCSR